MTQKGCALTRRRYVAAMPERHVHTNRLAGEKSPYLLQHQHNPVDWFPWGQDAFAKARRENKPIFLSIGYSTCHWCHVMERESFEDDKTAEFLNTHFVSIKVDREERPDVDKIYMTAVQALAGQGGWPLNCFLTPELEPFYGGTYFPPKNRHGMASFTDVLGRIAQLWTDQRDKILETASEFHRQLAAVAAREPGKLDVSAEWLDRAAVVFKHEFDPRFGGFGGAPKFPRPSEPLFLLGQSARSKDDEGAHMVLHTCERMAAGGIYDQLGGGFSRYSVDAQWLVPHFEKMLYDNAQLVNLYLDAWLMSGDPRHAGTVRGVVQYVLRDMTHPEGGFYSAEDADSEGKEGKFYCWTAVELSQLLTPAEARIATRHFGVTERGNFIDHSDPDSLPDQNVLSVADPNLTPDEQMTLASAKAKMFEARGKRIRPHLDDKVLASWNGMMLGALARAYSVLGEESFRVAAERNAAFLREKLWDEKSRTLYHRWRDGQRDSVQLLTAYANLCAGTIDLYEATLEPRHLEFAIALADAMLAKFYDAAHGGFYDSAAGNGELILRFKDDYDGAEPSGNSVAVLSLLRLAEISGRKEFSEAAEKTLLLMAARLRDVPQAAPHLLMGLAFLLGGTKRAVVTGDPNHPETKALLRAVHAVYQPNKVVLGTTGAVEPFARTLPAAGGPAVFVCSGNACQAPTSDPESVKRLMSPAPDPNPNLTP
jgi:uncharacterized protein